jgi:hypothetical protein
VRRFTDRADEAWEAAGLLDAFLERRSV